MHIFIAQTMTSYLRSMRELFRKCGYVGSGLFDPGMAFKQDIGELGF